MAVLHALLRSDVDARARPELADALARYRWLGEKRFLLVPYHLIGAESLEAAILGGYVAHVRREQPHAPLPAVYRAKGLIDDARELRKRMGIDAFRSGLPATQGEWGDVESSWTEADIEEAFDAPPDCPQAQRLISDVVPSRPRRFGRCSPSSGAPSTPTGPHGDRQARAARIAAARPSAAARRGARGAVRALPDLDPPVVGPVAHHLGGRH